MSPASDGRGRAGKWATTDPTDTTDATDTDTDTDTTDTTHTSGRRIDAADEALSLTFLVTAADLGGGWTPESGETTHAKDDGKGFAASCQAQAAGQAEVKRLTAGAPQSTPPDMTQGDLQFSQTAMVLGSEADAKAVLGIFSAPEVNACLEEDFGSGDGSTATVTTRSITGDVDQSAAWDITAASKGSALRASVLFLRSGRKLMGFAVFSKAGVAVADAQLQPLIDAAAKKLNASS